jgi:hypothetical protein
MANEVDAGGVVRVDGIYLHHPGVGIVSWDPISEAIRIEWRGWADSAERKAILESGLGALREHRGSRWLADCREMKAVKQEDQEWIEQSWFPRVLAAGLRRMAVVTPNSGLARMNLEDIMRRVPGTKLDSGSFATVEEATEWLTRPLTSPPNSR